jgi:hypothetical protein
VIKEEEVEGCVDVLVVGKSQMVERVRLPGCSSGDKHSRVNARSGAI